MASDGIRFEPSIALNTGFRMPMLGIGTWQSKPNEVRDAVEYALQIGYRHIDTAFVYQNEKEVGEAIAKKIADGTLKRQELFVTTKLWSSHHDPTRTMDGVRKSLANLGLTYVDLMLIHNPAAMPYLGDDNLFPKDANGALIFEKADHVSTWKELEKAVDEGIVRSLGLSNFNKRQVQNILDNARIKPANLQVEAHAYFMQKPLFDFCKQHGITLTAYGPLGSPTRWIIKPDDPVLLEDEIVSAIAKKHNKTPAQVLIRFLIERGRIAIPKSVRQERIKENFDVFDIKLSLDDLKQLDSLDKGVRYFEFSFIKDSPDFPFADPY